MMTEPKKPLRLFYCYARADKALRDELDIHLSGLKRQHGVISWYDGEISPGSEWEKEIDNQLRSAHLILLLITPHFMASDYCYSNEMKRALERHQKGTARVIPIILRRTDWEGAPFSSLQVLPTDAKPISQWADRDEAFWTIVAGIRKATTDLHITLKTQQELFDEGIALANLKRYDEALVAFTPPSQHTEVQQEKERKPRLDRFFITITAFLNTWLSFPKENGIVTEMAYIDQTKITATATINQLNETLAIIQSRNLLDVEIVEEILDIIKRLRLLEIKQFYLDGGKSLKEFCNLADDISTSMRTLIDEIRIRMIIEENENT